MTSPDFTTVAPRVSSTPMAQVNAIVARLAARKHDWPKVGLRERAELLDKCIERTLGISREWVRAACEAKGIDPGSARAGEEWLGGPMTTMRNLRLLADAMRAGGEPALPKITARPDGQLVSRRQRNAVLHDTTEIADRVASMVNDRRVDAVRKRVGP